MGDKFFTGLFGVAFLIWLAAVSAVVFVAYHFITKFW